MTTDERKKLLDKLSVQYFKAKRSRQGVVMSYKDVEQIIQELKKVQELEAAHG